MTDLAPHLWPSFERFQPRRYTCSKQKYTKVEAQTVVNHRMSSRHNRPEKLRIYHCGLCNGWHITHKDDYNDA